MAIELNYHLSYILNKYAPIRVKCINSRTNKWFNSDTLLAKQEMRKTERYFSKYPSESSLESLLKAKSYFKKSIEIAKNKYYYTEINQSTSNQKHLYGITNSVLGKSKERVLRDNSDHILCNNCSHYFIVKINNLCRTVNNNQYNIHNTSIDRSTLINQKLTELQPSS